MKHRRSWLELSADDLLAERFDRGTVVTYESTKPLTLAEALKAEGQELAMPVRGFRYLYAQCPVFTYQEGVGRIWTTRYGMELSASPRTLSAVQSALDKEYGQ